MKKLCLFTITTLFSASIFADLNQARGLVHEASTRLSNHRDRVNQSKAEIDNLRAQLSKARGGYGAGSKQAFAAQVERLKAQVDAHNQMVSETPVVIGQLSEATQTAGRAYRVNGGGQAGSWTVEEPNYQVQKAIVYKENAATTRSSY